MPFVKGNTIGQETRFKTGQSGNPGGRPKNFVTVAEHLKRTVPAMTDDQVVAS